MLLMAIWSRCKLECVLVDYLLSCSTLGCHVDGYVGVASHTVVNSAEITGRAADVLTAAWTCCEAALREIKVGNNSHNVTKVVEKVASEFNCTPLLGYASHEIKRHVIEGSRYFTSSTRLEEKTDAFTFGVNEAYAVNILVSTGEGKPKATEYKTTLYRMEVQNRYTLKTTLGRAFISQVNARFPAFPFHINAFEDERVLKVGLPEAVRHKLVTPYVVETEKGGELVAHFMFVVLLLAGGTKKICGLPFTQKDICKPEHSVQDEGLKKLLSVSRYRIILTPLSLPLTLKLRKAQSRRKLKAMPPNLRRPFRALCCNINERALLMICFHISTHLYLCRHSTYMTAGLRLFGHQTQSVDWSEDSPSV